ncbi:OsmC family peroxiredoxin [Demequina capsici]|uniref:OsmC family peroxiredoxin n=1 Tax=Demequina capsici TaxID=3075620 RepID=A0AA96J778_9MICO|nr:MULTISPECIES: OsmC family protein [unclassified Demequina]WNM23758.1 OsmC family peroxiredoxin [Demequina sp. OYTSA14]WNM26597.1 OsmC family peroxiredoxin [Demequina sp. PMTSA13]
METYEVTVASGSWCLPDAGGTRFPHRWTDEGVVTDAVFTGAHLLHLAVAGCVLNDTHREAQALGIEVRGVKVVARGGFDERTWTSTGIEYGVTVDASADAATLDVLHARVDAVAEIPFAVRAGASVVRVAA